jgi:ribosomal protein S18 acetylase RimI-like enzyme
VEPIDRVQSFLHVRVADRHEREDVGPFAVYTHLTDDAPPNNYALPLTPIHVVSPSLLDQVRAAFAAQYRTPCVTFLDQFAPALEPALLAAGWHMISRQTVLVCTRPTLVQPPLPPNVTMVTVSADSPLDVIREALDVNEQGFDPNAAPATEQDAAQFRPMLAGCQALVLRLGGQGVSGGIFVPIHDGVTEVMGVATLAAFRRRGFAAMVTAHVAQAAFEYGADLVFLVAKNDAAARVYQRVGFQPCAALLEFRFDAAP